MSPSSQALSRNPESFSKLRRSIVMGRAIAVLGNRADRHSGSVETILLNPGPIAGDSSAVDGDVAERRHRRVPVLAQGSETVRQITSPTLGREKLEELNRGEAAPLEFLGYVGPILTGALIGAERVEGITRFGVDGDAVFGVGIQIPQA